MKTTTLISTLVCCWGVTAAAQGVHLNAGDTFSFGFNGVSGCQFTEGTPPTAVTVAFGLDMLGPGESLQLEMFENTINDAPFASQIFSPVTGFTFVNLQGPAAWLDYQGAIRVTMLNGSIDVNYGYFTVGPNPNTFCTATVYPIPEPSVILLTSLSAGVPVAIWISRRVGRMMSGTPANYGAKRFENLDLFQR